MNLPITQWPFDCVYEFWLTVWWLLSLLVDWYTKEEEQCSELGGLLFCLCLLQGVLLSSKHLEPCDLTLSQWTFDCVSFIDCVFVLEFTCWVAYKGKIIVLERAENCVLKGNLTQHLKTNFTLIKLWLTEKVEFCLKKTFQELLRQFGFAEAHPRQDASQAG